MLFVELIWKNLRERPTRTVLTAVALAIAVAAIITLWSTAWGYANSSSNYYSARGTDIVVVRAGVSNRLTSRLHADLWRRLAELPGVARVDGTLTEMVSLGEAKLIGIPLRGYAADNPNIDRLQISSGRKLGPDDQAVAMLGSAIAQALGKREGDKVEIEGKRFEVAGIFLAENPFDANCIVAPIADVQNLMDRPGIVSEFQVGVDANVRDEPSLNKIGESIEALRDDQDQPLGLKAQPTNRFISSATESKLGNAMAWATSAIVIALSLMGMLNTMLMSVLERTRELGILRAVGWTRARIIRLILGESVAISLVGALLGSFVAWVLIRLLSHWPRTSLLMPPSLNVSAFALASLQQSLLALRAPSIRRTTRLACRRSTLCDMSSTLIQTAIPSEKSAVEPMLRVVNVSRAYDAGTLQALVDVSLTIRRGEYLAIMGPSGSGKSTLLNLLGALDRPTSGDIFFEGDSLVERVDLDRFRATTLGFVFQSFHLLPTLTALENVQIPMFETPFSARQRVSKAAELLELVEMSHRASHLPAKLSVGERQRVAIARALANDPKLLLADEPTGNLDSGSGQIVLDLFDRLHSERGLTLVVITHDAQVAARAQRVVRIRDGRIQES